MKFLCVTDDIKKDFLSLSSAAEAVINGAVPDFLYFGEESEKSVRLPVKEGGDYSVFRFPRDNAETENMARAVAALLSQNVYNFVIFSSSPEMKTVAAFFAALADAGFTSGITGIERTESPGRPLYVKPTAAEGAAVRISSDSAVQIISVKTDFFGPDSPLCETAEILFSEFGGDSGRKTVNILSRTRRKKDIPLEKRKMVLGAGRGISGKENFARLCEIAEILNAGIGVTRPLCDEGYAPAESQIGLTGKVLSPEIYLAFGISGKIQHLYGVSKSRKIISVNTDESAEMNKAADLAIIEDSGKLLPVLLEKIKKEKKREKT